MDRRHLGWTLEIASTKNILNTTIVLDVSACAHARVRETVVRKVDFRLLEWNAGLECVSSSRPMVSWGRCPL